MEFFVAQTFNGLSYAALIFLLGGGMTLIFGVMKIVNIAQGSFILWGGILATSSSATRGIFTWRFSGHVLHSSSSE